MNDLYTHIKLWWKQATCSHDWEYFQVSQNHYDEESWFTCRKCDKEVEE